MKSDDIDKWIVPEWHSDFGEPVEQLKMLSNFCKSLIKVNSEWSVILNNIEEGYLSVDIHDKSNNKLAELYIVDDDTGGEKYGLFYDFDDEKELYFTDIRTGVAHLERISGVV